MLLMGMGKYVSCKERRSQGYGYGEICVLQGKAEPRVGKREMVTFVGIEGFECGLRALETYLYREERGAGVK